MSFNLPDVTPFVIVFFTVAAIAVVLAVGSLATFFVHPHTTRVRRHEGASQHYGHLVLGH